MAYVSFQHKTFVDRRRSSGHKTDFERFMELHGPLQQWHRDVLVNLDLRKAEARTLAYYSGQHLDKCIKVYKTRQRTPATSPRESWDLDRLDWFYNEYK